MGDITVWSAAAAILAGLACGFLNTTASAGSAVSLPVLIMIGLDPLTANATNRIPVLLAACSATSSFHAKRLIDWPLAVRVGVPATVGSLFGALLAQVLSIQALGLVITGAVLIALILLFTKLKQAIARDQTGPIRFGRREQLLVLALGCWIGLIAVDANTYMLLVLTLAVGLNLTGANAIKAAVAIPTTLIAMAVFTLHGNVNWLIGIPMALGSIGGGLLGARFATHPTARRFIFPLLVVVISGELIHLLWHYLFQTM